MKIIPILFLAILLHGCSTFKTPVIPTNNVQTITLDSSALEPCLPLNEDLVIKDFNDVVVIYSDLAGQYGACANKQAASIKLLKEFSSKGSK